MAAGGLGLDPGFCDGGSALGCTGGLPTGGLGAGFLVSKEGEEQAEEVASGDTGGLFLAFMAASLGECLRLGGIGVSGF